MENENQTETRKRYDPITQPVSYAVKYGLVPEIRNLIESDNLSSNDEEKIK